MAAKSKMLLLKTTFNDKLAFKAHIDDVKKTGSHMLHAIKRVRKIPKRWASKVTLFFY